MIKLSIKNEKKLETEKEFKGVLSLRQDGKSVTLTIEDSDPDEFPWNILEIQADGTFYRCIGLPENIGLQVDKGGRIIESEE